MSKHKHHIIPRYICKELGIDPDFDENIVEVDRLDHARIHWGYKCDDLEPLFEYITPAQWIIDLIPRGDNRDVGAAVLTARGEIDGIVPLSGEEHPLWKGGVSFDMKTYQEEWNKKNPDYWKEYQEECNKKNPDYWKDRAADPVRKEKRRKNRPSQAGSKYMQEWRKKNPDYQKEYQAKKAEAQS
jgi:hypothetical protein